MEIETICTCDSRDLIDPEIEAALILDGAKIKYAWDGDCYLVLVRVPDYSD